MTDKVTVTVKEGKVRGIKNKSEFSGANFYSFFGIPYGQSTGGYARFKDPVKVKPWKNIIDATTEKEGCSQFCFRLRRIAGSEDCLYNNIHTPHLPTKNSPLKPVIVNIHPGGFSHGSPDTYYHGSPEYVMHQDIVYVCIAYRLHLLGFLNLELRECSGNQGLKDIILGLHWIRNNITVFGGDSNNITLLGGSSGATLVHALMLSPAAKGLFHKAVVMGLYNFSPVLVTKRDHKEEAFELARTLGYNSSEKYDGKKLLAFYKNPILSQLFNFRPEIALNKNMAGLFPSSPFKLTRDHGINCVYPERPDQLINSTARIPLMFGICEREGVLGFTAPYRKGTMDNFYSSYRQNRRAWGHHITDDEVEEIKEKIDSFYLKGSSLETASLSLKVDIQTDISYSNVYETLIDVVSADLPSSVFVYKFEFEGNVCSMKDIVQPALEEQLDGTYHLTDFSYWAYINHYRGLKTEPHTPRTRQMIETFTKLICTFARNGNPNYGGLSVEWKPTNPKRPCYLSINDTSNMVEGKLNGERMEFWEKIIKQYKKL